MDLELQKYPKEVLNNPVRPKNALWEVVYDYDGRFSVFITEEEKQAFLEALDMGSNYVEIRGYVLSKSFLLIRFSDEMARDLENKEPSWKKDVDLTRKLMLDREKHFNNLKGNN